jgi:hypothetical protein
MLTPDKITEIFCVVDDFCKEFAFSRNSLARIQVTQLRGKTKPRHSHARVKIRI